MCGVYMHVKEKSSLLGAVKFLSRYREFIALPRNVFRNSGLAIFPKA